MKMNIKDRSTGIILSYVYFVMNTIISIFMSAFVIRTVGKTDYGIYQSMSAFVSYLVLLEFGTGTIMSRNLSLCRKDGTQDDKVQRNISTIWSLTLFLVVAMILVSLCFEASIDTIYINSLSVDQRSLGKRIFALSAFGLLCSFMTQTLSGLLISYEYYAIDKIVQLIKLIIRSLLVVCALLIKQEVLIVVIIDTFISISVLVFNIIFCKRIIKVSLSISSFDKEILKQIGPLAFAMLLQTIVNTANGSVDKFLISIMMTPEDVSIYSVSMNIFSMFSTVATLPVTMYMPQIAKNMKNGMRGRQLTSSLIQPCRLNIIISGLIAFGFSVIGQQFIEIIYGTQYSESWLYAIIVILPMYINMSNAVVINVIDVLNKRHVRSLILMLTTVFNIVFTIIGIRWLGMIGAAAATALSLLGQVITLNIYYHRSIGIDIPMLFYESFKGILPSFIFSSISAFIVTLMIQSTFLGFFAGGVTFVVLFAFIFFKFGATSVEREKISNLLHRKLKHLSK